MVEKRADPSYKRAADTTFALVGLLLSLPFWVLIPAAIYAEDGGPVFFLQDRLGRGGRRFRILKFRTMKHGPGSSHAVISVKDDPRVTRVGRILRATALDELPALVNIVKGDMSFVGPKPLPPKIDERARSPYDNITQVPGYEVRSKATPGLTGVAQIYAAKDVGHRGRFRYDALYVRKRSFWLDVRLIAMSFWFTFRRKWERVDRRESTEITAPISNMGGQKAETSATASGKGDTWTL